MKKLILPFLALCMTLTSCILEEPCKNYKIVTESNEKEARLKCRGLANNYPQSNVISSINAGCLTLKEFKEASKANSIQTIEYCNNVYVTIKVSLQ